MHRIRDDDNPACYVDLAFSSSTRNHSRGQQPMSIHTTVRQISHAPTTLHRTRSARKPEATTVVAPVGEHTDVDDLVVTLYTELRRLAHARMRWLPAGHTLQPTALVHEVYIRLQRKNIVWANRAHFYFVAARAMRDILVEHARKKARPKHGGRMKRVEFTISIHDRGGTMSAREILQLHHALDHMQREHPDQAELVQLYYFGGLTSREIARHTERSLRTVERHMRFARAWLRSYLASVESAAT